MANGRPWLGTEVLCLAVPTLVWGSTWIVIRDQLATVPAQWSVTYRFAIGSAAMFGLARLRRERMAIDMRALAAIAPVGICEFGITFNAVYAAEQHMPSGLVGTIFALQMLPNSLLAWALLNQRPTREFIISSVIAVTGISLMLGAAYSAGHSGIHAGVTLALLGLLAASLANVWQARAECVKLPFATFLAWAMLIGTMADGLFALATVGSPTVDTRAQYWAGLFYLSIASSVIAYGLYYRFIRSAGPAYGAYAGVFVPVVALALSTAFEGYRWTIATATSAAMALAGLGGALAWRPRSTQGTAGAPADDFGEGCNGPRMIWAEKHS